MKEVWKSVPGKEDKYEASSYGRIRNIQTGTILQYGRNKNGYCTVSLLYGGRTCSTLAHLVIAAAFYGARPTGWHTRHLDTNKENNAPDNLKYGTVLENVMDSYEKGLFKNPPLTERKRKIVRALLRSGMRQVDIARRVMLPAQCICRENKALRRETSTNSIRRL